MVIAMPDTNTQSNNKPSHNAVVANCSAQIPTNSEESPNIIVYRKMEKLVEQMQDEVAGVPVRTVKSFMSKIPSVFTGSDLVAWMMKNLDVDDQTEALHLAHLMAAHGYFFPIDDHILTMKNDGTFYRFQTPYFWPSNCWEPENTDYAVYLCKRTMQNKARLELSDFEAENLARLQKMFSRKWEFIFMQAEAQSRVDKKRDKLERKVLDSQERAFWDVHRPVPGCVNTTEIDIKKACSTNKPGQNKSLQVQLQGAKSGLTPNSTVALIAATPTAAASAETSDDSNNAPAAVATSTITQVQKDPIAVLKREIETLKQKIDRRNLKISKVSESYIAYYEQYLDYDPMLTAPELPNPWISESIEAWDLEKLDEVPARRVKRWAFSLKELLNDPAGREHFSKFLDKEFSGENLKFWEAIETLKNLPLSQVPDEVTSIWAEYLAPDAKCSVNIDCRSLELTKEALNPPSRWSFDVAAAHVYQLMKTDSYQRYLRSEMYKDFLSGSKKKTSVKGIRSIVNFTGRKDTLVP